MLQGYTRPTVKVVDFQDIVFRIQLVHFVYPKLLTLETGQVQHVVLVNATELRLAMIHIVLALAQVEVHDVDRIYFLDVVVVLATINVLGDQLRGAKENALEVGIFRLALNLYQQQLAISVLGKNVHTVHLGLLAVFITLALQQTVNFHVRA